jgi:hypothetical protein
MSEFIHKWYSFIYRERGNNLGELSSSGVVSTVQPVVVSSSSVDATVAAAFVVQVGTTLSRSVAAVQEVFIVAGIVAAAVDAAFIYCVDATLACEVQSVEQIAQRLVDGGISCAQSCRDVVIRLQVEAISCR